MSRLINDHFLLLADDYLKGLMQNYATNAPVILIETMIRFVNPLFNKYTYTEITFDLKVPLVWGPVCTHKTQSQARVSYQSCWKLGWINQYVKWLSGTLFEEGWMSREVGVIAHVIREKSIPLQSIAVTGITLLNDNKLNKITNVPVLKFSPYYLLDKHCMSTVYCILALLTMFLIA